MQKNRHMKHFPIDLLQTLTQSVSLDPALPPHDTLREVLEAARHLLEAPNAADARVLLEKIVYELPTARPELIDEDLEGRQRGCPLRWCYFEAGALLGALLDSEAFAAARLDSSSPS